MQSTASFANPNLDELLLKEVQPVLHIAANTMAPRPHQGPNTTGGTTSKLPSSKLDKATTMASAPPKGHDRQPTRIINKRKKMEPYKDRDYDPTRHATTEQVREGAFRAERLNQLNVQRELPPYIRSFADKVRDSAKLDKDNMYKPTENQVIHPKASDNPISIRYMSKEVQMPPFPMAFRLIEAHEEHRFQLHYPALINVHPIKYKWYMEIHPSTWRHDPKDQKYRYFCEPITPADNIPKTLCQPAEPHYKAGKQTAHAHRVPGPMRPASDVNQPEAQSDGEHDKALLEEIAKYERVKRFCTWPCPPYCPVGILPEHCSPLSLDMKLIISRDLRGRLLPSRLRRQARVRCPQIQRPSEEHPR